MKQIFAAIFILFASISHGGAWLEDGKLAAETQSRKSLNDFSAMLVVTPGDDWEKEWKTSPETVPMIKEADKAKLGDKLTVLTIFANPAPDHEKKFNVVCALKVTRPNGTVSVSQEDIPCLHGELNGPASYVWLSPAIIKFTAEATDPLGVWKVDATVEDKNRNTKIELHTQYEYIGSGG